ncbi:hypothetical protein NT2_09_00220 [Caenibius tardaugens NBRC 16725]|uniref:HTH araC/xylS-type domain-containing protein n=1 Tax=Caenibius tardaugens NBRC 16725 TaxID=1219035 RepID=U2ZYG8_9SPHN|nr:AraC family transcriptional regulator [Caenibius tardaugens]AZI35488.1 AraC family transcriptional regulator [Caenibius tardaugens NBRC 16725]GAD50414.1 hypothetical protein NT2_09_00220 [Caenibius tardaugens NBRC 16725]
MALTTTHGQICTATVRVHVYNYQYDGDGPYVRQSPADVLALFAAPPKNAMGSYRRAMETSARVPLGQMMIVPAHTAIQATGDFGEQRLATCTMRRLLPDDFDIDDITRQRACGDLREPNILAGMQRLISEALQPGFASDVLIDGLTRTLQADLARHFSGSASTLHSKMEAVHSALAPWQLRKIESFTSEAQGSPVRVAALANEVGLSPGHLMRAFRQSTGQTVHEFVEQVRVARARALLLDTDKPIKQIADLLGFSSPSSFTLAFRRATGESPARLRRKRSDGFGEPEQ